MNIVTVLNKLKSVHMIADNDEGIALFSDCFNKFGISLLLLKDEEKFSMIVDLLVENKISLQKANGIYNFRVFAVEYEDLKRTIAAFKDLGELDFLRQYPEMLAAPMDLKKILNNMKKIAQSSYKKDKEYQLDVLLMDLDDMMKPKEEVNDIATYFKTILEDKDLMDKVKNKIAGNEEDSLTSLELQKVENKICEEYLYPVNDTWKIIIDQKEVNSFQNIKDTINTLLELNIAVSYHDALLFVLFYKSPLSVAEIDAIVKKYFMAGGIK